MKRTFYFIVFLFCSFSNSYGLIIGSDTAVSRNQSTPQFPDADIDNEIRGFVAMDSGFSLEGGATTCTYNAFFPVSGAVSLNGGSLYLNQDLIFSNTFTIPTVGKIFGNNHSLRFPSGMTEASFLGAGGGKILNFITQVDPTAGGLQNVASVDWSSNNSYLAVGIDNMGAPHHELRVYYFDGSSLTLTASFFDAGTVNVNSVRWHPTDNFLAVGANVTAGSGNQDFNIFKFDESTGIFSRTQLISGRPLRAVSWSPNGDYLVTGSNVNSATQSEVQIYSFSTVTGQVSFIDQYVVAGESRDVNNSAISWAPDGNPYFAVGFTNGGDTLDAELNIYHFDGTTLTLTYSVAINQNVRHVDWSSSGSFIAVGLAGSTERLRVYRHRPPIGAQPGIVYEETTAQVGLSKTVRKVHWGKDGTKLAIGTNSGAGVEIGVYDFDATTTTLSLNTSNAVETGVNVDAIRLDGDDNYLATGDFNGFVEIYSFASTFLFENIFLFFDSDINFKSTISFQGDCKISMQGNQLKFSDQGTLEVKSGALLTLDASNLELENASPFSVKTDGTLKIKDSNLHMLSNIIFPDGALEIEGDVDLSGNFTFNYQSEFTSTITANSVFCVKEGARFSLGRSSTSAQQPLEFKDDTSVLAFDGSTLNVTSTGILLKKGKIKINTNVIFDVDGTLTQLGLILGDGTDGNDLKLEISPGANLNLNDGILVLNSFADDAVKFEGFIGRISLKLGSLLFVERPLNIVNGEFFYDNINTLSVGANAYLTANDMKLGTTIDNYEARLTGTLSDLFTFNFEDNDFYELLGGLGKKNINVKGQDVLVGGVGLCNCVFVLEDANSEILWRLDSPVNFDSTLNGGKISLLKDLFFVADKKLLTYGTVDLARNSVYLGPVDHSWTSSIDWVSSDNGSLILNSLVSLSSTWTFSGAVKLEGNGNQLIVGKTGKIVTAENSDLTLRNITLKFEDGAQFFGVNDTSKLTFDGVKIILAGNVTFNSGALKFERDSTLVGPGTLFYTSNATSTIMKNSSLEIMDDATFSIGRSGAGRAFDLPQPLEFVDETSLLRMDGGTLAITGTGAQFKKGHLLIESRIVFDVENTQTQYGLILGDGTLANDFKLHLTIAASDLVLQNGTLVYNEFASNKIESVGNGAITLKDGVLFFIERPCTILDGSLVYDNANTLSIASNSYLIGNKASLKSGTEELVLTGTIKSFDSFILDQNDVVLFDRGVSDQLITVSRDNNLVEGAGFFEGKISLIDENSTFTFKNLTALHQNIPLNGGLMKLGIGAVLEGGKQLQTTGTLDLNLHSLSTGAFETVEDANLFITGQNGMIKLNADIELLGTWTFNNNVVIEGRGRKLEIKDPGGLVVDSNSVLILHDIILDNIHDVNIRCVDDSASIIYQNVRMDVHGTYSFKKGSMKFEGVNNFFGGTFVYESSMSSTIASDASLKLSDGLTFSIGRSGDLSSNEPLAFISGTSKLEIEDATLHVTSSGMRLTKGEIIANDEAKIDIDTTLTTFGLVVGDGTSVNDFDIHIRAGGLLDVRRGALKYEGSTPNKIKFDTPSSGLSLQSSTILHLGNDLTLEKGRFKVDRNNSLAFDSNVTLQEIETLHDAGEHIDRHSIFQTEPGVVFLKSGGYFRILEGIRSKIPIFVRESNTRIDGSGVMTNSLVIQDSSVTFTVALSSVLGNDIILNGGKIVLDNDLSFATNCYVTGSGTVDTNGHIISFGGEDFRFTDSLIWDGATNLVLNSKMTLATSFTFNGVTNINGNGNIVEFDVGGGIYVGPGGVLHLTDLVLKDLGVMANQLALLDDTAEIRMSNVMIELDNSITNTIGGIVIEGPTTFGLKGHTWTLDLDASMTISGMTLWIDSLDQPTPGSIVFGTLEANHLALTENGTIKGVINGDLIRTETAFFAEVIEGNSHTILTMRPIVEGNSYSVLTNSQSIINNSNTIVTMRPVVEGNSHTILTMRSIVEGNSYSVLTNSQSIINNSNAILSGAGSVSPAISAIIEGNSNTIISLNFIRSLSSAAETKSDSITNLLNDLLLTTTLSFVGTNTLNGFTHILDLTNNGTLQINSGGELYLTDVVIKGVSAGNIFCIDDTGKIKMSNVVLVLDSDFTFSHGALEFRNNVEFIGKHKFTYQSQMTSTIYSDAHLMFSNGLTFSYDPLNGSNNLIEFEDSSAILSHNDSTMHTTTVGIQFAKGQVVVSDNVTFESEVTTSVSIADDGDEIFTTTREVDKGITFGDGVTANNTSLTILGGSVLRMNLGSLVYNNTDPDSLSMVNDASILRIGAGAALRLHDNMNVSNGVLEFEATSTFKRKVGKNIIGSVNLLGPVVLKYF